MTMNFVLPEEPEPAIELFARSLATMIGADVSSSESASPDQVLAMRDGAVFTLRLDPQELSVRVENRGTILGSIPYSLPGIPAGPRPQRLRVVFAGSATSDRRLRMTSKVIVEARGRNRRCELLLTGVVPADWSRASLPDRHFGDLTSTEVLRLVCASSCVLECGDEIETPTSLALIATAAGVPVLVHRSSVLALRRPSSVVAVDEWNADAFVDAIFTPLREVPPFTSDVKADFLGIVERGRV